jgi:hypothetical protein
MKYLSFLIVMIGIIYFSCSKNDSTPIPASLAGKWRMILVTESASGVKITKPASIEKDVDIIFTSASPTEGTLSGNTPTNSIYQSDYMTRANGALTIPGLNITKVRETSWGYEFVNNILNAKEYNFESDVRLNIQTTDKILTFKKL